MHGTGGSSGSSGPTAPSSATLRSDAMAVSTAPSAAYGAVALLADRGDGTEARRRVAEHGHDRHADDGDHRQREDQARSAFGIATSRGHHVGLLVPWSVYVYGVGDGLAGVGEFGFAVMSICTHRVFSSQPAFSIGAPPGFDVKHVTTGVSPSEIAATDCCAAPPLGQYSRRSRWFNGSDESKAYVTVLLAVRRRQRSRCCARRSRRSSRSGAPPPPHPPALRDRVRIGDVVGEVGRRDERAA